MDTDIGMEGKAGAEEVEVEFEVEHQDGTGLRIREVEDDPYGLEHDDVAAVAELEAWEKDAKDRSGRMCRIEDISEARWASASSSISSCDREGSDRQTRRRC